VPLITHTQRLFYNSSTHVNGSGNLYYHTGSGNNLHGVKWNDLKYAIRVHNIIEAIQTQYQVISLQKQATINILSCLCGYTEKRVLLKQETK
jgi:hypothetical protein